MGGIWAGNYILYRRFSWGVASWQESVCVWLHHLHVPLVPKYKRSCFSQGQRSAVQLPLNCVYLVSCPVYTQSGKIVLEGDKCSPSGSRTLNDICKPSVENLLYTASPLDFLSLFCHIFCMEEKYSTISLIPRPHPA